MSHYLSGKSKEMGPILQIGLLAINQVQVGLIDQGRTLESVARVLTQQVPMCQTTELTVNMSKQLLLRRLVSVPPSHQQLGHFHRRGNHPKASVQRMPKYITPFR